jgi:F0F1-type ATP synthase alpha subunit
MVARTPSALQIKQAKKKANDAMKKLEKYENLKKAADKKAKADKKKVAKKKTTKKTTKKKSKK